jgi:hypothetical protein
LRPEKPQPRGGTLGLFDVQAVAGSFIVSPKVVLLLARPELLVGNPLLRGDILAVQYFDRTRFPAGGATLEDVAAILGVGARSLEAVFGGPVAASGDGVPGFLVRVGARVKIGPFGEGRERRFRTTRVNLFCHWPNLSVRKRERGGSLCHLKLAGRSGDDPI